MPEENLKGAFSPPVETLRVPMNLPLKHFHHTILRLAPDFGIVPVMPYRQICSAVPRVATAHALAGHHLLRVYSG